MDVQLERSNTQNSLLSREDRRVADDALDANVQVRGVTVGNKSSLKNNNCIGVRYLAADNCVNESAPDGEESG